jgi:hypothetical protein
VCWLQDHGIEAAPELVKEIFRRAKQADKVLTDAEILEIRQACSAGRAEPKEALGAGAGAVPPTPGVS